MLGIVLALIFTWVSKLNAFVCLSRVREWRREMRLISQRCVREKLVVSDTWWFWWVLYVEYKWLISLHLWEVDYIQYLIVTFLFKECILFMLIILLFRIYNFKPLNSNSRTFKLLNGSSIALIPVETIEDTYSSFCLRAAKYNFQHLVAPDVGS